MSGWASCLLQAQQRREAAVLVTVAATRGSAPRDAGAAMVVTPGEAHGTIGGGHLEFRAVEIARDLLRVPQAREMRRFPLAASLGQCCGGVVELLFERVGAGAEWPAAVSRAVQDGQPALLVRETTGTAEPRVVAAETQAAGLEPAIAAAVAGMLRAQERTARLVRGNEGRAFLLEPLAAPGFELWLFGAGHVARALVRTLSGIDCRIVWIDERSGEFPPSLPGNVVVESPDAPVALVRRAPAGAYFLVMTHSHALDFELSEAILRRADFRWFGLIGSATKRRRFEQRLAARGLPGTALARMACPIGVGGITSKEPAAIAVAVAAQILQVHEACGLGSQVTGELSKTATAGRND
ncbi:MAG TPA: xanthine dehydrogenase accessory protein XdhC [Burkholderiales bacterium]